MEETTQDKIQKICDNLHKIENELDELILKEKQQLIEKICKKYKLSVKDVKAEFLGKTKKIKQKNMLELISNDYSEQEAETKNVQKDIVLIKKKIDGKFYFVDSVNNIIFNNEKKAIIVGRVENGEYKINA